jgi:hypothetical protein
MIKRTLLYCFMLICLPFVGCKKEDLQKQASQDAVKGKNNPTKVTETLETVVEEDEPGLTDPDADLFWDRETYTLVDSLAGTYGGVCMVVYTSSWSVGNGDIDTSIDTTYKYFERSLVKGPNNELTLRNWNLDLYPNFLDGLNHKTLFFDFSGHSYSHITMQWNRVDDPSFQKVTYYEWSQEGGGSGQGHTKEKICIMERT